MACSAGERSEKVVLRVAAVVLMRIENANVQIKSVGGIKKETL